VNVCLTHARIHIHTRKKVLNLYKTETEPKRVQYRNQECIASLRKYSKVAAGMKETNENGHSEGKETDSEGKENGRSVENKSTLTHSLTNCRTTSPPRPGQVISYWKIAKGAPVSHSLLGIAKGASGNGGGIDQTDSVQRVLLSFQHDVRHREMDQHYLNDGQHRISDDRTCDGVSNTVAIGVIPFTNALVNLFIGVQLADTKRASDHQNHDAKYVQA